MSDLTIGDVALLEYKLTDDAGAPIDATVVCTLTAPDGTVSAPAITHPATGTYRALPLVDQAGVWAYLFTASGAAVDTEGGRFYVQAAPTLTDGLADIRPTAQDIADVIPRRALDADGLGRGTFTAGTVPTDSQAVRIGARVAADVLSAVPGLPPQMWEQARWVASLGAAAQIELAFWPETATTVAAALREQYQQALAALTTAVELATGTDQPGAGSGTGGDVVVPAGVAFDFSDDLCRIPGIELAAGGRCWPCP